MRQMERDRRAVWARSWKDRRVDGFGHWFAGFVAGEGSFTVRVFRTRGYLMIDPEFAIRVRADDKSVIVEIRNWLGVGRVQPRGVCVNRQGIKSNPSVTLSVRRLKNCLRVIEVLDRFPLRAKKRRDYLVWRAIVQALASLPHGNRWSGVIDRSSVVALVAQLREGRRYAA